jgi:hypothetical protein
MISDPRPFGSIPTGQRGYLTRRQANAGGVSDAMLRSRTQSGLLDQHGVRTFASPLLPHTQLGALQALMLDIGGPVWAFGPTAGALHDYDDCPLVQPFHLVTERDRNVRRLGHVIHSVVELEPLDREQAYGLAVVSPTRTLIDLARSATPRQLTAALDSALRDGKTTEDFLHRRIADLRSSGRYGIPALLAVIEGSEATRGGHSWLERRFLELVGSAGLPVPETQVVLSRRDQRLIRVDCFFRAQRLVVELLGYRWHRTRAQMASDAERANRLTLDGHRLLQFPYSVIAGSPERVVLDLSKGLAAAA